MIFLFWFCFCFLVLRQDWPGHSCGAGRGSRRRTERSPAATGTPLGGAEAEPPGGGEERGRRREFSSSRAAKPDFASAPGAESSPKLSGISRGRPDTPRPPRPGSLLPPPGGAVPVLAASPRPRLCLLGRSFPVEGFLSPVAQLTGLLSSYREKSARVQRGPGPANTRPREI